MARVLASETEESAQPLLVLENVSEIDCMDSQEKEAAARQEGV